MKKKLLNTTVFPMVISGPIWELFLLLPQKRRLCQIPLWIQLQLPIYRLYLSSSDLFRTLYIAFLKYIHIHILTHASLFDCRWSRCQLCGDRAASNRNWAILLHRGPQHGRAHALPARGRRLSSASLQGDGRVHQVHCEHLGGRPLLSPVCAANWYAPEIRHWPVEAARAPLQLALRDHWVLCGAPAALHQQGAQPQRATEAHQLCLAKISTSYA